MYLTQFRRLICFCSELIAYCIFYYNTSTPVLVTCKDLSGVFFFLSSLLVFLFLTFSNFLHKHHRGKSFFFFVKRVSYVRYPYSIYYWFYFMLYFSSERRPTSSLREMESETGVSPRAMLLKLTN